MREMIKYKRELVSRMRNARAEGGTRRRAARFRVIHERQIQMHGTNNIFARPRVEEDEIIDADSGKYD